MDFNVEQTPVATSVANYRNVDFKLTAFLNTAAEARFSFTPITHRHHPLRNRLPYVRPIATISFTQPLPVFLDGSGSGLQAAVSSMLCCLTCCFQDPHNAYIDIIMRPHLSDFFLQTVQYCNNGRGVSICVDANMHFVVPDPGEMVHNGLVLDSEEIALDSAIAKLERLKVADFRQIGDFGQDACCICFEEFEIKKESELARMPCLHVFHYECIVQWLERSRVCPLCRYQMR